MKPRARQSRALWLISAGSALLLAWLFIFAIRSNQCVDYVPESGRESVCTSEPLVGVGGAWALGAAAVLFAGFAVYRALRDER